MRCSRGVIAAGSFRATPSFAQKAGRILDLYGKTWEGMPLGPDDFVISADEKPSLQARRRKHPTLAPGPARPMRVEHEYFRKGALTYLAAWDAHHGRLFGRCEPKTTIAAVDQLVAQVMTVEPYRSASRVFWISDNCSSHRGERGRSASSRTVAYADAGAHAQPRELVEPGRNLFLGRPTQCHHPE